MKIKLILETSKIVLKYGYIFFQFGSGQCPILIFPVEVEMYRIQIEVWIVFFFLFYLFEADFQGAL